MVAVGWRGLLILQRKAWVCLPLLKLVLGQEFGCADLVSGDQARHGSATARTTLTHDRLPGSLAVRSWGTAQTGF